MQIREVIQTHSRKSIASLVDQSALRRNMKVGI